MTCSTTNPLVEHVARAIFDREGFICDDDQRMFQPYPFEEIDEVDTAKYHDFACSAIRATLEWLGENVSGEMIERSLGWREYDIPDHWPDEARVPYGMFRAMLSTALKELEGK